LPDLSSAPSASLRARLAPSATSVVQVSVPAEIVDIDQRPVPMVEPRLEQLQAGHQPRPSSSCDEPASRCPRRQWGQVTADHREGPARSVEISRPGAFWNQTRRSLGPSGGRPEGCDIAEIADSNRRTRTR
jgi:hypothetical protein